MAADFGTVEHDGNTLTIMQAPYPTGDIRAVSGEVPMYWEAIAEDEDGEEYKVRWPQTDEYDGEDGSTACDWNVYTVQPL